MVRLVLYTAGAAAITSGLIYAQVAEPWHVLIAMTGGLGVVAAKSWR